MTIKNTGLGRQDLISIGKGLLIAVGGAALTYGATVLQHYSTDPRFINYAFYFTLGTFLINVARKLLDGEKA